jgi:hypothetical protein
LFTISAEAADRALVTLDEVEELMGAEWAAQVTEALILQTSDLISRECGIAWDGVTPPTLRQETLVETFRRCRRDERLILARRFVESVSSITEGGEALSSSYYEVDGAAGIIIRLDADGNETCWPETRIVVTYTAGFDTVPQDLKLATIHALQEQVSASSRDPLLRGETVDGIGRQDYWVNAPASDKAASAFSPTTMAMLSRFMSVYA